MSLECDFFLLHLTQNQKFEISLNSALLTRFDSPNSIGNFVFYLHNSFTLSTLTLGNINSKMQIFGSFDENIFYIYLHHIFSCLRKISIMMSAKSPTV